MTTNDDTALLVLNELILAGNDGAKGYEAAAAQVSAPELATLFLEFCEQRKAFVAELEDRVRTLRASPPKASTPAGSLHRAWMGLKAALASNEIHAVLAEVERGEDVAVKAYAMALQQSDLDEQTRRIIQRQYESVQAAHDRVRQLRDRSLSAPL